MVALLPAFGEQSIPSRVKIAIALCFTFVVTPAVFELVSQSLGKQQALTVFLFTETLAGLALGIGIRLFVLALQTAGAIAAQATSLSQLLGGTGIDPLPALGHILVVSGLALAVIFDLHVHAVALMIASYDIFPIARFPDKTLLSEWGIYQVASAFGLAFTLASPFFIGSIIYNAALGIINKAMPQLMVAFVGAPAITGASIFLLAVSAPFLLELWMSTFSQFLANPMGR